MVVSLLAPAPPSSSRLKPANLGPGRSPGSLLGTVGAFVTEVNLGEPVSFRAVSMFDVCLGEASAVVESLGDSGVCWVGNWCPVFHCWRTLTTLRNGPATSRGS